MDAHADAVARAKAIAARLAGTSASVSLSSAPAASAASGSAANVSALLDAALNPNKRSVDDALNAALSDTNKRHRSDGYECVRKVNIPVEENPGYNYIGLLIGPGGSKQRELVASAGGNVKISIRGKGSNKDSSTPGNEEPLHVLLEGSTSCVERAEKLVETLLANPDEEKRRQLSSINEEKGGYVPKPVSAILGAGSSSALSIYGPQSGEPVIEEKIGIPNGVVGYIIGRGGESITSMQRRTNCRVQIQKEHEMAPGTAQRVITLTAASKDSVAACRAIIENMVKERMVQSNSISIGSGNNATSQMAQLQKALAEGQAHVTCKVPDADVGLVIGKGGMQIKLIQEKSGANIQIPQMADTDNPAMRTVNITHQNKEGAEFAKTMIEEVLKEKAQSGGGGDVTIQVNVSFISVGFASWCVCMSVPLMPSSAEVRKLRSGRSSRGVRKSSVDESVPIRRVLVFRSLIHFT
mmetsp:Transcript_32830/g.74978  ORF Transcript_32830/g.74978 Transcript_32830/m.74978 type:complete len:468 (+) Transcript_32830:31-1434(+)